MDFCQIPSKAIAREKAQIPRLKSALGVQGGFKMTVSQKSLRLIFIMHFLLISLGLGFLANAAENSNWITSVSSCSDSQTGALTYHYTGFLSAEKEWKLSFEKDATPSKEIATQIAAKWIKNLETLEPLRAERLIERLALIEKRIQFTQLPLPRPALIQTHVSSQNLSSNCSELTLALMKEKLNERDELSIPEMNSEISISKELWDRLSEKTKAAALLEVLLTEDAIRFGHTTNEVPTYLVSLLASKEIKDLKEEDWEDLMLDLSFGWAYGDSPESYLDLSEIEFNKKGILVSARPLGLLELNGVTFLPYEKVQFSLSGAPLSGYVANLQIVQTDADSDLSESDLETTRFHGTAEFFEEGGLKSVQIEIPTNLTLYGTSYYVSGKLLFNAETGQISGLTGLEPQWVSFNGSELYLEGDLEFYLNGKIKNAKLVRPSQVPLAQGENALIWGQVLFHDTGFIALAHPAKKQKFWSKDLGSFRSQKYIYDPRYYAYTLRADPLIVVDSEGNPLKAGVFPIDEKATHFIRVVFDESAHEKVGFRYCQILDLKNCEVIGDREFYDRSFLRKNLRFNGGDNKISLFYSPDQSLFGKRHTLLNQKQAVSHFVSGNYFITTDLEKTKELLWNALRSL